MLYGRSTEQATLRRVIEEASRGVSGALVVRGEPGIGKSALLDDAAETARAEMSMRVLRGAGVESEARLAFAGLHLLLRPALGRLESLPGPQRRALEGAFGLGPGVPADRMLVGLAVLTLLSELADEGPLVCLVDDAQWLDQPSAEALLFAVRRLDAEPIAVILAVRDGAAHLPTPALPELRVAGLGPQDAAALVDAQGGELGPGVRQRVLTEAEGNPLALIELPAAVTSQGSAPGGALPLTSRLQAAFHGQVRLLPEATQTLLLIAAADDTGELPVLLNAAKPLAADVHDLAPALDAGLVVLDEADRRLSFRHPLVRAAVYQGAPLHRRLRAHQALAAVLDGVERADRRAWHLAAAATGPDEHAAAELERAAVQAGERNGHASAAAAYERAASLSTDDGARGRRLAHAAAAAVQAGNLRSARALAERAAPHVSDPAMHAGLVRVLAAAKAGEGSLRSANDLLLADAAADPRGGMALLMEAVGNAWFAGERDMAAQCAAHLDAMRVEAGDPLLPVHQLHDWIISLVLGRSTDHLPPMAEVVLAASDIHVEHGRDRTHDIGLGLIAGLDLWSLDLANTVVTESRATGAIGALPAALYHVAITESMLGRYRDAAANAAEALDIARDTGQWQWISLANGVLAYHAAIEGDEERTRHLAAEARSDSLDQVFSPGVHRAEWALGLLDLGYGRAEAALERLEPLGRGSGGHQLPGERSAPDLIEAAVRVGAHERADGPFARFQAVARRVGQPSVDALLERCWALLSSGDRADAHYAAALHSHDKDSRPFEHARTRLLYGEWLRRARRKAEAREHLRTALETFDDIDAWPWAERARIELDATGLAVKHRQVPGALSRLTPQELQITRLAAQGLSNRDIAAQLFLSPRTVGHHLYKAFPKLGVASRGELTALHLTD